MVIASKLTQPKHTPPQAEAEARAEASTESQAQTEAGRYSVHRLKL